jgi:hypothetical protein
LTNKLTAEVDKQNVRKYRDKLEEVAEEGLGSSEDTEELQRPEWTLLLVHGGDNCDCDCLHVCV